MNEDFGTVANYNSTVIIGKKESIEATLPQLLESLGLDEASPTPIIQSMVNSLDAKTGGSSSTLLVLDEDDVDSVHKLSFGGLPTKISRNNHPMAVHTLTRLSSSLANMDNTRLVVLTDDFAVGPLASAIAKAFPLFSQKSKAAKKKTVNVRFVQKDGSFVTDQETLKSAEVAARGVRLTGRLVDSHPELLTTSQFVKEIQALVDKFNGAVRMKQIIGKDLDAMGYGGVYGVGKGASCPPRMVFLEYDGVNPDATDETVALIGKGIVYDTGGLSLKVSFYTLSVPRFLCPAPILYFLIT